MQIGFLSVFPLHFSNPATLTLVHFSTRKTNLHLCLFNVVIVVVVVVVVAIVVVVMVFVIVVVVAMVT